MAKKHYNIYNQVGTDSSEITIPRPNISENKKNFAEEIKQVVSSPSNKEDTVPETVNGIVIGTDLVRFRMEPNYEAEVLYLIRKGTDVEILGEEGEFKEVSFLGNHGYISSKFLEIL